MIEHGVIYNGDPIILTETQRKLVIHEMLKMQIL